MERYYTVFVLGLVFFCCLLNARLEDDAEWEQMLGGVLTPSGEHCIFDAGGDPTVVVMTFDEHHIPCYRAYPLGNITISGSYRLASKITKQLVIATSNVTLDLNGNSIAGGIVINSGLSNITIKNGNVDATGSNTDGISVGSGCTRIKLFGLVVRNSSMRGIVCTNVGDSIIRNCEMTRNTSGLACNNCYNVVIENCTASRNSQTGFGLVLSTTCSLLGCQALSTGDNNNTAAINNSIYGFLSQNGCGNIFNTCIANATQALSTTDFGSVIAGFALTGTEQCSQIIACEASHAATSASGVTVPYGIYLQGTISNFPTVTIVVPSMPSNIDGVSWSPDGIYLLVGDQVSGSSAAVYIYQFNRASQGLTQVATVTPPSSGTVWAFDVAWSPSGTYFAVAIRSGTPSVFVYSFNRSNNTVTQLAAQTLSGAGDVAYRLVWSVDQQYIAVGAGNTNSLYIYNFDQVAQKLTQVFVGGPAALSEAIAWSPDKKYIVLGDDTITNGLSLYAFNPFSPYATLLAQINPNFNQGIHDIQFTSDGQYFAVTGSAARVDIYTIDRIHLIFDLVATQTITTGTNSTTAVAWSADGQYLAVGFIVKPGFGNQVSTAVYRFDRGTLTLTQVGVLPQTSNVSGVYTPRLAWSPDGRYIAQIFTATGVIVYAALSFPLDNVIMNNTVYCNSGAQYPSGVGISGSSICNLIIQNTAYANPINAPIVSTSYYFVCNVFNQLFNNDPGLAQNMVLDYLQPVSLPINIQLLSEQCLSLASHIQSVIAFVYNSVI